MAFLQCVLPSSMQLWRDVIDSLVSHSLWLRVLLGLPEKETTYLDVPEELGQTLCSLFCTWSSPSPASAFHTPLVIHGVGPCYPFLCCQGLEPKSGLSITLVQFPQCTGGVPEELKVCLCHTYVGEWRSRDRNQASCTCPTVPF